MPRGLLRYGAIRPSPVSRRSMTLLSHRRPIRWAVAGLAIAAPAAAVAIVSCLPGDTRPEPGSVLVSVAPQAALVAGVVTDDGWTVTFGRLLVALGNIQLQGDACNSYSEANYDRLFDMVKATELQKIGQAWGLGSCKLEFRMRTPSSDSLLGQGATLGDVELMRTRGADPWTTSARVAVIARGTATLGAETKRFSWAFRQGYAVQDCTEGPGGGGSSELAVRGGDALAVSLEVRPQELFRIGADDSAPTRFGLFADADADGDGDITLEELTKIPKPIWEADAGAADGGDAGDAGDADSADSGEAGSGGSGAWTEGAGGATVEQSLGGLLYNELVGRLVRISGGGSCKTEVRGRGR